jgi:RTX calcium-binding nonapeptide repeat (4 copies)
MSRTRLIAALVGALLTLAFATTALAAGGGSPGADDVSGSARGDHISLQAGDDRANGGRGNDDINGGRGDDRINGGVGDDRLRGGSGDDVLTDDNGTDRFSGGTGDDRIVARDRRGRHDARDIVDCGTGDDTALVDDDDVVRHCEHVERAADDHGVHAPGTDDKGIAPGADDPAGHK